MFYEKALFVCTEQDEPIATCFIWKAYGKFNTIHWMKVIKEYEGLGIGRALLSHLLKELPSAAYPIYLHTQPGSYRAIKLYSDFGFQILSNKKIGTRENDFEECLPILQQCMPEKDFQQLTITPAPAFFLEQLQLFDTVEFQIFKMPAIYTFLIHPTMKVHLLQTGTVRCKQFQLTGASNNLSRLYQLVFTQKWGEWMPTYCWLIEHPEGLILVDTGETAQIYEDGYLPKGGLYHKAVETRIKEAEEIPHQLAKIGYSPKDISTIIFTHLHGDHIGGLAHFEHCNCYVSATEYQLATSKKGPGNGYFVNNWPNWFKPTLIQYEHGAEGNFVKSQQITTDGSIVVIPTPGHSEGHQSILVKDPSFTYFIAGDLTYNEQTLQQEIPDVVLMNKAAQQTVEQVHQYVKNTPSIYLSSHDWNAVEILANKKVFGA